ncbi:MFS general substrate transporter [Xylaria intraflava]|nr:MFS general substrate transporter [Xylaria intraflava]
MSRTDDISLHEEPLSGVCAVSGDDGMSTTPDAGQMAAGRRRALILLGASISQLPTWDFTMSYGVFQEFYVNNWTLGGNRDVTGLDVPPADGGRSRRRASKGGPRWAARWSTVRRTPSLGELVQQHRRGAEPSRRGVRESRCRARTSSAPPCRSSRALCPENHGFRTAMRVWAAVALGTGLVSIALDPHAPGEHGPRPRPRTRTTAGAGGPPPGSSCGNRTFYVYSVAIVLQSAGYGIPQSYLPTYAREIPRVSSTSATLPLTVFNIPGIPASSLFGYAERQQIPPRVRQNGDGPSRRYAPRPRPSCSAGLTSQGKSSAATPVRRHVRLSSRGGYSTTWGGVGERAGEPRPRCATRRSMRA